MIIFSESVLLADDGAFAFRKPPALRISFLTECQYCVIQLHVKNYIYILFSNLLKERLILVMLTFLGQ